ncbi:hypothetical protein B296_00030179 [Ensete ventricosum]|uniref:XPG N-terminal domain-containing protein n=1 Tax=Ensete ventricosum TaxID=4639 RepID=A0A427AJB9_ENSVE|nr:hypothetical protein B296_00030179 [Ensete ventricosum]
MGVQGLWELLAPVGRRVSVETLAGKKLAIGTLVLLDFPSLPTAFLIAIPLLLLCLLFADASIWMVQFMKAMRDDKGEMVLNAHLLGFFRRICKLLFLRTKPVFVFDGATPALKRRTVAARRRHRDSARAKIRKTAEKLLLNHVCLSRSLSFSLPPSSFQLSDSEIKKQKEGSKQKQITEEDTKGKKVLDSNDEIGAEGSGKCSLLSSQPKLVKEVSVSKHVKDFGPDVETYCDENGRVRVSRVKGLGIHMTRDLQRNLDLMEKYEQEKRRGDNSSDLEASHTKKVVDVSEGLSGNNRSPSVVTSNEGKGETFTGKSSSLPLDRRGHMDELTIHGNEDAIEISFSEDDSGMKATDDDNIFMQLVSGGQTANLPLDCVRSDKSTNDSESDCSWEEGLVKEISEVPNGCADITASPKIDLKKNQSSLAESSYQVAVVDWEEGVSQNPDTSSQFLDKPVKDVSRGTLEEEADIQEAIRRSLEDFKEQHSSTNSSAATELERSMKDRISDGVILHKLVTNTCVHLDNAEESPSCNDGQLDNPCKEDDLQIPDSSKNNLDSYNLSGLDLDGESSLISRREDEQNVMTSQRGNIPPGKPSDDRPSWLEQSLDASYDVQTKSCSIMSMEELCEVRPDTSTKITDDGSKVVGSLNLDSCHISRSSVSPERGYNDSLSGNSSLMEEVIDTGMKSQQNAEKNNVISDHIGYSAQISLENQMEVSEASLDKEISLLRQERVNLGNEQRMLERDAESVNNEMFAECQVLFSPFWYFRRKSLKI